jgi:hypothetical protein
MARSRQNFILRLFFAIVLCCFTASLFAQSAGLSLDDSDSPSTAKDNSLDNSECAGLAQRSPSPIGIAVGPFGQKHVPERCARSCGGEPPESRLIGNSILRPQVSEYPVFRELRSCRLENHLPDNPTLGRFPGRARALVPRQAMRRLTFNSLWTRVMAEYSRVVSVRVHRPHRPTLSMANSLCP